MICSNAGATADTACDHGGGRAAADVLQWTLLRNGAWITLAPIDGPSHCEQVIALAEPVNRRAEGGGSCDNLDKYVGQIGYLRGIHSHTKLEVYKNILRVSKGCGFLVALLS